MRVILALTLLCEITGPSPEQSANHAIAALTKIGGRVHSGANTTFVHLSSRTTDQNLLHLPALPNVRSVMIMSNHVTDTGMVCLAGLPELSMLTLSRCPMISDKGLSHLRELPGLTMLSLNGTAITDEGLVHLDGLPKLRSLGMDVDQLTEKSVPHLEKLSSLRLYGKKITKDDISRVASLHGLNSIGLMAPEVEGLEQLDSFEIRYLTFFDTHLKPEQIHQIMSMTWLTRLYLYKTTLNDATIEELRTALPGTTVTVL